MDYSPWGQELDTTDQLSTAQHKTMLGQTKPVPWPNEAAHGHEGHKGWTWRDLLSFGYL